MAFHTNKEMEPGPAFIYKCEFEIQLGIWKNVMEESWHLILEGRTEQKVQIIFQSGKRIS